MTRPLKILQVYRTFFPDTQGGAEEMIRQLAMGLQQQGCESRVFVPSLKPTPREIEVSGVPVIRPRMHFEVASCGFALTSLAEFQRQVAWADVVNYHFPWPFADLLDLLADVSKPKVITYHSDVVRQKLLLAFYRPLMERFLRSADAVVATSSPYVESSAVLNRLSNVKVVPIGIDPNSYPEPNESERRDVLTRYGEGYFFFVGMLRYYKGLHILLEACSGTNLTVVIAGVGPEQEALKQQAKKLGLENVKFIGRVSDEEKIALIDGARALVFPSHLRSEAFGVTLLEGLMRGKPLITAEVGTGTSYVNSHSQTGYVVEANNPAQLRDAMLKLMDDSVVEQFGFAAKQRFDALFTARHMVSSYKRIYQQLVDNRA
ncbi:MAG: glycosyltransferase [Pseudomonadales bacterium]